MKGTGVKQRVLSIIHNSVRLNEKRCVRERGSVHSYNTKKTQPKQKIRTTQNNQV